jgi:hypothetical protein
MPDGSAIFTTSQPPAPLRANQRSPEADAIEREGAALGLLAGDG